MMYALIKTFISVYLVYAFIELFIEVKEIIEDKTYGIKHCPTWYTLNAVICSTLVLTVTGIILYIWF